MTLRKIGFLTLLLIFTAIVLSGCSNSEKKPPSVNGESEPVEDIKKINNHQTTVYFFWGKGCPHCAEEKPWLEDLEKKYDKLEVKSIETYTDQENAELFQNMAEAYGIQARGVPATFIGDFEPIVGFSEGLAPKMEEKIKTCLKDGCINPASKLKDLSNNQ
jgi:entry exclusion lipoprotein TrbK